MPWTAILGLVAFFGVQLAFVGASLYAYNRMRSQQDTQGQQREAWTAKLELAVTTADTAKRLAESIEVDHFKKLRALYEVQGAELAEAKARILSLERELKVCQMKLASEERINRRDESRRQKEEAAHAAKEPAGVPTAAGAAGVDDLLHGHGIPLFPQTNGAPAQVPSTFGKTAKGR